VASEPCCLSSAISLAITFHAESFQQLGRVTADSLLRCFISSASSHRIHTLLFEVGGESGRRSHLRESTDGNARSAASPAESFSLLVASLSSCADSRSSAARGICGDDSGRPLGLRIRQGSTRDFRPFSSQALHTKLHSLVHSAGCSSALAPAVGQVACAFPI
jgi:hypothetical protein